MRLVVSHPNGAWFHAPPQWPHFGTFIKWGWSVNVDNGVSVADLLKVRGGERG